MTGGGSQESGSRDGRNGGGGARPGSLWLGPAPPPAPRPSPLPALEHVALTIYGAADAAVREPGSPGAAATKARGSGAGAAAASRPRLRRLLPPSVPAGGPGAERATGGSGKPAQPPIPFPSFHLRPGVCGGGEPEQRSPPGYSHTHSALASTTRGFPKGGGEPGVSHLRAHSPPPRARL